MSKEVKYYEERKGSRNEVCCEPENKYSKWKVEEAYRALLDAKKALADPKMKKYIGMCAKVKMAEAAAASKEAGMIAKVGIKLKEIYSG